MISPLPFPTQLEQYIATAIRLAVRLLGSYDAAEDAVQEGLIKAYRAWGGFEGGNARAWFLCIIRHTCYDHLRAQKRRPTESLEAMLETENNETVHLSRHRSISPDQIILQQETMQALLHMIETLPHDYQVVLQLVDLEGYGYTEVSALLNIPIGTVKSRLCRGRSLVRDQLVNMGIVVHQE